MASHRRLASNVGVGLLALSVLVLGAQSNTAVMLASENQPLVSAPGNDGKNDNGNNKKSRGKATPSTSSPATRTGTRLRQRRKRALRQFRKRLLALPGTAPPAVPGNGPSGPREWLPRHPAARPSCRHLRTGKKQLGRRGNNGNGTAEDRSLTPRPSRFPPPGRLPAIRGR